MTRRTLRIAAAVIAAAVSAVAAPAALAAPGGVTGMALDGRVELAWQPETGATGYKVYRGTTPTTVTTPLMANPLSPPGPGVPASYTDIGPANGTIYYYAVRSIVGGVESANSRIVRATPRAATCTGANVVVQENCRPGDTDWKVAAGASNSDAFATASSIDHGQSVGIKVQAGTTVDMEIFRTGAYNGAGARLFSEILDVPVGTQPACINDANTGRLDCSNWAVNQTITTTTNWPSGVYLIRVTRDDTLNEGHVLLVVRDDARHADVLYGIPDTTYQAYNEWGGKSLYVGKSTGPNTVTGTARAAKVSFDRPYSQPEITLEHDWYTRSDFATVRWLEAAGYDVSYSAASDLERSGAEVLEHRVYISGSHDEYYSTAMRNALTTAGNSGIDLFFTGANDIYWKVRFEPNLAGAQDRTLVCYKTTESGPVDPSGTPTGTWRDPAGANAPENAVEGSLYIGQNNTTNFALRVSAAEGKDRIWRYTGLENQSPGTFTNLGSSIVGWEWDARVSNGQEPPGVTTLASSPVTGDLLADAGRNYTPGSAMVHAVKRQLASGAWVVDTGTNQWNWGLALNAINNGDVNARIQQATTNILFDMGAVPETPAAGIILDDPTAPPAITLKSPANAATGVQPNATVRATFSRPMDPSTITASTFTLTRPDGTAVAGAVTYDPVSFTATFAPAFALDLETTYAARLAATVRAENGVALGTPQTWSFTTRPPDRTPPVATITAPAAGSLIVTGSTITATASDDSAVSGVQFKVDGNDVGIEDTTAPYSVAWDARGLSAGTHTLTAVARDSSGNSGTSAPVNVTVDPTGLVAAYGFEETTGTAATDSSGKSNGGTLAGGVTRTTSGRFGRALQFDGVDDIVNVADSSSLDLTNAMTLEAWVNPSAAGGWRTALLKEQTGGLAYGIYSNIDVNRPSAHVYTTREFDTRGTAALATNAWTHLAATYDGATLRLYVNGTQVSTAAVTGNMVNGTGGLKIGGNSVWGERFAGRIDEVRVYRRVLSAAEVQTDMNLSIVAPDSQPPTAPSGLTATGGLGQVQLSWNAATDDNGVVRYNVHRGTTPGFVPSAANRVAQPTSTSYTDLVAAGTWYYRVTAEDGAANVGPASNEASAAATADVTPPTVTMTAPAAGATVTGNVTVSASASDNVGVAGVQFKLDGADLAGEDTSAPFSVTWDARSASNGNHTLTAVARDGASNRTTAQTINVTVDNPPVDLSGLVGAWGFEAGTGTAAVDSSPAGNDGTLNGGTAWATAGRFGKGLTFDGSDDRVTIADADTLDLAIGMTVEAWVNPTAVTNWRTVLMKEGTAALSYGVYANGDTNRPSVHANTGNEVDTRGTAALPANTWSHLAATYDGANLRLYLNGTQVSSRALTGPLNATSGPLRLGGNAMWGEAFAGTIDEVRVYRRALTAGEIQTDMSTAIVGAVTDSQAPTAPGTLSATGGLGQVQLSWGAAADNIGVAKYNVHRGSSAGFTPSTTNRIAQPTGTTYADTSVTPGTWYYLVMAQDAAGNVGPASNVASGTATSDTTPPTVSITAPAAGTTVNGTVNVTANAADNVAVAGVQFKLDGANLGAEDTSAPYSVPWDTLTAAAGAHTLTAVARDGAGQTTTSAGVTVSVDNPPVDTSGLVGAWGFEEGAGATVDDTSMAGNDGSITGAAWTDSGRFGNALTFDGIDDLVTIPDADSLDASDALTVEAWVKPAQHGAWHNVLLKEKSGGQLAYALYGTAWTDFPSAHVNTNAEDSTRGTAQLPPNTWSHLAMTYDGAALRLYVDGTQVSSKAISGPIGASTLPLRIGGNSIWGEHFKGAIDEVRIYRRVLTAAQIVADRDKPVRDDAAPPAGPDKTGQFAGVQTWPLVPVHMAQTSNGKILVWDGFDAALNSERVWDPQTGTFDPVPTGRNLFCAGHVTLPDGRVFIAGGHIEANLGTKDANIFNPVNKSWFRAPDMQRARWYPTATTLPDGRVLVVSGDNITLNAPNVIVPLKNGSETLPEIYDVDTNTWTTLPAGQRRMPLYPFMFVLPNGKVFDAGPDTTTRTLDVNTGQWTTVGQSPIDGHSAVMYRPGKILKSGTWADPDYPGIQSTSRAAAIDMTEASPSWREVAPMHHPRSYHTLTALPDGTVLATGGATETDGIDPDNAVFATEIWDPVTDTWTETAAHQRPRMYHSSSILLPDGRVLLAGGGAFAPAANESNAEIYSPPYLFKGTRPTITTAPVTLNYGQTFSITTPDASKIQKISLVRMGSVTHNFDMDQRFQWLDVRPGSQAGTLETDAPADANIAPPGYYHVFVIDDKGVPSKGWTLKIDHASGDAIPPSAPGNPSATVSDDDVQLNWSAATDNVGVTQYRIHRSTTAGFTPSDANRIATVASGTTYTDSNLAAGTYRYKVVAADAAGNTGPASGEGTATVAADTTPPATSLTAPAAGANVSGANVSVTANASDNRGVTSVQFRLDGNDLGSADTSAPYSTVWNTTATSNGNHTLTAVARDAAGNTTTSAPVTVNVDNGTPPTVSITAPTGGTVSGAVSVTANAGDDRGVASVQFKVDGTNLGSADTSSPYSATWNTVGVANGLHTLTAVATDSDGNTTTSAAVTVTVSNASTGLVAAFGFDEASGTTATDTSGNGNTGTINGPTRTTPGKFGGALSFDGLNDQVSVADAASLDLTNAMTLEAWVRPSVLTSWRTILMKEQAGGLVYGLYANGDNNRPSVHIHTNQERDARGTAALALNTWTHIAATFDGAVLRFYVNGTQVSTANISGSMTVSTGLLRIGGNSVWGEWFGGMIDEVRVYRRALSAAEIGTDMNAPVVAPG
jgi:Concanavalin A-like lectin/glucanases superfamily/Domain of unknown function (DUF1929)/Bacterial Ig domain/Bacterial Ig-like domain/Galactose oxidase, central domain